MPLIIDTIQVFVNCRRGDIHQALESAAGACTKDVEWRVSAYEGPEIPAGMTEITLRGPADIVARRPWQEQSAGVYRRLITCASREWPLELERSVRTLIE